MREKLEKTAKELIAQLELRDRFRTTEAREQLIFDALARVTIEGMELIVARYGEYTKKSPAYDAMRATKVETEESFK